ncbi:MAG: hypothetical protein AAF907_00945 [Planctomycetota bacterium]
MSISGPNVFSRMRLSTVCCRVWAGLNLAFAPAWFGWRLVDDHADALNPAVRANHWLLPAIDWRLVTPSWDQFEAIDDAFTSGFLLVWASLVFAAAWTIVSPSGMTVRRAVGWGVAFLVGLFCGLSPAVAGLFWWRLPGRAEAEKPLPA